MPGVKAAQVRWNWHKKRFAAAFFCRECGFKPELLRFVYENGAVVLDWEQKRPGRGAYVHRRLACISRMAAPSRFEKALRLTGGCLEPAALRVLMQEALDKGLAREVEAAAAVGKVLNRKL